MVFIFFISSFPNTVYDVSFNDDSISSIIVYIEAPFKVIL